MTRDRIYKNLDESSRTDFMIEVSIKAQMYQDLALAIFSGFPQDELETRELFPFGRGSQDATDNAEGTAMPYQIQLKRKNGKIDPLAKPVRAPDSPPAVGDVIQCTSNSEIVSAKITAIEPTNVGAQIGQQLIVIHADEIFRRLG
jgi:hypothetical protein